MTCPERTRRERYCGRDFSESELALIRALIAEDPTRTRADLSRLACQALQWLKLDGGLKDMSCRVAMLRMQKDGLIHLPPPRGQRPQARIFTSVNTDPQTRKPGVIKSDAPPKYPGYAACFSTPCQ